MTAIKVDDPQWVKDAPALRALQNEMVILDSPEKLAKYSAHIGELRLGDHINIRKCLGCLMTEQEMLNEALLQQYLK